MDSITLSKQQYRCLYFLSYGMTYKEIAREMSLSPRTVEYYIEAIRRKTNLKTKSKLVAFFLQNNYRLKDDISMYA